MAQEGKNEKQPMNIVMTIPRTFTLYEWKNDEKKLFTGKGVFSPIEVKWMSSFQRGSLPMFKQWGYSHAQGFETDLHELKSYAILNHYTDLVFRNAMNRFVFFEWDMVRKVNMLSEEDFREEKRNQEMSEFLMKYIQSVRSDWQRWISYKLTTASSAAMIVLIVASRILTLIAYEKYSVAWTLTHQLKKWMKQLLEKEEEEEEESEEKEEKESEKSEEENEEEEEEEEEEDE